MSFLEEDLEKCKIYHKFYSKNQDLFKKDAVEYWRLCRRYYESVKNPGINSRACWVLEHAQELFFLSHELK